ncbi:hypothetical protein TRFO_12907 [Tritrichomonas foetus]|uniref:Uncharacterized protein n=1 Tax=Tritrichomonas foetus TaxID=1144522 RepID=A0A1J4KZZ1_9EUKA|nr:hypothetical protein TRFO_12907 [Tritrichomonas foetus]|eukprot:OHT16825.1 hypothetical protein TRFO_12907 [Tritrichomonas foetus]
MKNGSILPMNYFSFLQRYYSFYANLRFKRSHVVFIQWFVALWCFFQYTFFALKIEPPSTLLTIDKNSSPINHIQCFFLVLPWIFASRNFLYDSFFFLMLHIFSFIVLELGIRSLKNRDYCPIFCFSFIRIFQNYFSMIFRFPTFFRISSLIKLADTDSSPETWLSFSICLVNIMLFAVQSYFSSIFLDPIDFIPKSKLDLYDGKSNIILFFFQFVISICCFLIDMIKDQIFVILVAALIFIFCSILFYFRVMSNIHVSLIGAYIELAPLFSLPFAIIVRKFFSKEWTFMLLTIIIVHILLIIALKVEKYYIVKETWKIFRVFIHKNSASENDNEIEISSFAPGNVVSGLRVMAIVHSDPRFFDRFLAIQKRTGPRASPMIEVIRFLAIFPSRRRAMLKELSEIRSASNYNRFTIYYFMKLLRSLSHNCDERHKIILYNLQRSLIVHNHLYWVSRSQKKFFSSFVEACSAASFYLKFKREISSLLSRYPFDASLYVRYADFLLLACGDFDGSKRYLQLADELKKNQLYMADPLIHRYVKFNPNLLKFCNEEESRSSIFVNYRKKAIERPKNNEDQNINPVSSYLNISNKLVPFFPVIHHFLTSILILVFLYRAIPFENFTFYLYNGIQDSKNVTIETYQKAGASIFFPIGVTYGVDPDFQHTNFTDEYCRSYYDALFYRIINFFNYIPQMKGLNSFLIQLTSDMSSIYITNQRDICDILLGIEDIFQVVPINMLDQLDIALEERIANVLTIYEHVSLDYYVSSSLLIFFIVTICAIVVYISMMCIQLNTIMKSQDSAIAFFSSKERLMCNLFEKTEKSWDALTLYLPEYKQFNLRKYKITGSSNSSSDIEFFKKIESNSDHKEENYFDSDNSENSHTTSQNNIESSNESDESISGSALYSDNDEILKIGSKKPDTKSGDSKKSSHDNLNNEYHFNQLHQELISAKQGESDVISESSDDDYSQEIDIHEQIEYTVNQTKKDTQFEWINMIIILFIPYILLLLSMILLIYPVNNRVEMEKKIAGNVVQSGNQVLSCFSLIKNTYLYVFYDNISTQFFVDTHNSFLYGNPNVSALYTKEQCMQLNGITCTTISDLVKEIILKTISTETILLVSLPAFIYFGQNVLENIFYQDVFSLSSIPKSSEYAFFVIITILVLIYLIYGYYVNHAIVESFNSLYHYPNEFLDHKTLDDQSNSKKLKKLPSMVVSVSTLSKNNEIYSISENTNSIFNRTAKSFIGFNFEKMFPLSASENREYLMPDKSTKKVFKTSLTKADKVNRILMIEDSTLHNKKAYMEETISEKLMNFIPTYYAKALGNSFIKSFEYENPIIIFLRFDSSLPTMTLEQYFALINGSIMNFSSIKAISADGGLFKFITIKNINPLIPFIFVRDLIEESSHPKRGKPTNGTFAILIDVLPKFSADINDEDEPFLDNHIESNKLKEKLTFNLEKNEVCFNYKLENAIPGISANGDRKHYPEYSEDTYSSYSFEKYLSYISHFM